MGNVIQAIRDNISIVEYAQSIGLHPVKRKGNTESWYLEEHDSLIIKPQKNDSCQQWFVWNSQGVQGSIIDFAMAMNGWNQATAVHELRLYLSSQNQSLPKPKTEQKPEKKSRNIFSNNAIFSLPPKSETGQSRIFAYLCKSRGIDGQLVSTLSKQKQIYQDARGNVVFVGYDYDQTPQYASIRGTLSDVQFRGDVLGSNKTIGFSINLVGQTPTRLFVCESPIDAMSLASMMKYFGRNSKQYAYLSLGGTATNALSYHLERHPQLKTIYLAQDHDEAGLKSRVACRKLLAESGFAGHIIDKIPTGKDYNDDLLAIRQAQQIVQSQSQNINYSIRR